VSGTIVVDGEPVISCLLVGPLVLSLGVSALHIYAMDILRGQPSTTPEQTGEPGGIEREARPMKGEARNESLQG
jgi:hypothetical protein